MMDELFPFLAAQTLQVALLAVVVWVVVKTCCKRRPHLAHALWLLVLIKCIVPPVFSSSTGIYSWLLKEEKSLPTATATGIVDETGQLPSTPSEPAFVQGHFPSDAGKIVAKPSPSVSFNLKPTTRPKVTTPPANRVAQAFSKPIVKPTPKTSLPSRPAKVAQVPVAQVVSASPQIVAENDLVPTATIWQAWIVKAWLFGVALSLAVTLIRFLKFRRWIRRQEAIENDDVESVVNNLATQLKLRKKVRVKVIDAEFGPAIMGLFRPTIVLPYSLVAEKTPEELEPMLAHELIHFRRGDTYWSVLQVIACSLMWFHPLVWLASKNVTRESERCCDEETIANFDCDRANYARMLVDVLEQKSRLRIAPVVPGVRPADVTSSRLEQIMETDSGKRKRTPRWVWALVLILGFAVIPGAAIVQSQESTKDEPVATVTDAPVQTFAPAPVVPIVSTATVAKPAQATNRIATLTVKPSAGSGTFQGDRRWRTPDGQPFGTSTQQHPNSATPKSVLQSGFGVAQTTNTFNPQSSLKGIAKKVAALALNDEEGEKISKELLANEIWKSAEARERLSNLKSTPVEVEIRFWLDTEQRAEELLDETTLALHENAHSWTYAEQQMSMDEFQKLLDETKDVITEPTLQTWFSENEKLKHIPAQRFTRVVSGIQAISILDPSSTQPLNRLTPEGAVLSATLDASSADSINISGQLVVNTLIPSKGRKLPLMLGDQSIVIENAVPEQLQHEVSWNIPDDKVQIFRTKLANRGQREMLVFVKATRKSPLLDDGLGLTMEQLSDIEKQLKAIPKPEAFMAVKTPSSPSGYTSVPAPAGESLAESESDRKPLSLSLRCGDKEANSRSLSTTLKLANNTTLTIEGDIDSQQISVETVQIQGREFSFKNEEEGSFSASASGGSISFSRNGPLESSLQFSLKSNAKLTFAGIEFAADSINCYPNRIEATGNVKVSIPEIESSVTSNRVVLDLQQFAFDFDGSVAVERKVGGDFPFLLKSNHVGWSLVSGEMQTDRRFNSANRSAVNRTISSRPPVSNPFGSNAATRSSFGPPVSSTPRPASRTPRQPSAYRSVVPPVRINPQGQ